MKYFVTRPQNLVSFNIKVKAGDTPDLTPETADAWNVACPGLVEEYDPEKHNPAPVFDPEPAPGFLVAPVTEAVKTAAVEAAPPAEEDAAEPVEPAEAEKAGE